MASKADYVKRKISNEQLFEDFIIEGQYSAGDSNNFDGGSEIPWLDMDLAQSGQTFFQRHYFSIIFAHSLYFGLGFGFKPITGVVFQTRGFRGLESTMKRVLSTIWHVVSWYEHDIIGPFATGTKAIANIRKTHAIMRNKCIRNNFKTSEVDDHPPPIPSPRDVILEALKSDMNFLDTSTFGRMNLSYNPPVHMSQFSMAITQISFLLPVFVNPEGFGIWDTEGVEGFEHLWALIGRLSGLEDRYNIPLHRPGKDFYLKVYEEVYVPSFLVRDLKINSIQESYFKSSNAFMPPLSVAGSFYLFLKQTKLEGFNGPELYKLLTFSDKISCLIYKFLFHILGCSKSLKTVVNSLVRSVMQKVLKKYTQEKDQDNGEEPSGNTMSPWSETYGRQNENPTKK